METILRAVQDASGLSRRKAFAAIREGRVSIDGSTVHEPSREYAGGLLALDGAPLTPRSGGHMYLALHKPPDYITTLSDERGRKTVMDLVPQKLRAPGLHAVGRLDRDTSGLLLLTTDGDLTFLLTHPRHEVEKEYWLRLAAEMNEEQLGALRGGVELDGFVLRLARVRRLVDSEPFQLSVTVREGRNRQVRRMLESVGAKVVSLRRVREGPVRLGDLAEGAVRELSEAEVGGLRGAAGG